MDNTYLLFFLGGFHFLLPLMRVERVTGMNDREPELVMADPGELAEGAQAMGQPYLIIADGGGRVGIGAERVDGLVHVEKDRIYPLPDPVRTDANRYLAGVARMEEEETGVWLAYVLNPLFLTRQPAG